jgi:hypothetical protein
MAVGRDSGKGLFISGNDGNWQNGGAAFDLVITKKKPTYPKEV